MPEEETLCSGNFLSFVYSIFKLSNFLYNRKKNKNEIVSIEKGKRTIYTYK